MMRTGVKPRKAATEFLHREAAGLQIDAISVSDFKFAASRPFELASDLDDAWIVKVKPRYRPIRFRLLRFFLNMNGQPAIVEIENPVASRVVNPMAEHGSPAATVRGVLHEFTQSGAVKNIVAKD